MKNIILRMILACGVLLNSQPSSSEPFVEGKDYYVIDKVDERYDGTVMEFFSYACPFCYRAEWAMEKLELKPIDGVALSRVPVHFGKSKEKVAATVWYLAKSLGMGDKMHTYIYDVIHAPIGSEWQYNHLAYMEDVEKFFLSLGVPQNTYDQALEDVQKSKSVERTDDLAKRFLVGGTPTFIVNGKYKVEGIPAGPDGKQRLENVLRYLAEL